MWPSHTGTPGLSRWKRWVNTMHHGMLDPVGINRSANKREESGALEASGVRLDSFKTGSSLRFGCWRSEPTCCCTLQLSKLYCRPACEASCATWHALGVLGSPARRILEPKAMDHLGPMAQTQILLCVAQVTASHDSPQEAGKRGMQLCGPYKGSMKFTCQCKRQKLLGQPTIMLSSVSLTTSAFPLPRSRGPQRTHKQEDPAVWL